MAASPGWGGRKTARAEGAGRRLCQAGTPRKSPIRKAGDKQQLAPMLEQVAENTGPQSEFRGIRACGDLNFAAIAVHQRAGQPLPWRGPAPANQPASHFLNSRQTPGVSESQTE